MIILLVSIYNLRSFKKFCKVSLQTEILCWRWSSSKIGVKLRACLSTSSGNIAFTEESLTLAPRPEAIDKLEYLLSACCQWLNKRTIFSQFIPVIREISFIECRFEDNNKHKHRSRVTWLSLFYTNLPILAFLLLLNLQISYIIEYEINILIFNNIYKNISIYIFNYLICIWNNTFKFQLLKKVTKVTLFFIFSCVTFFIYYWFKIIIYYRWKLVVEFICSFNFGEAIASVSLIFFRKKKGKIALRSFADSLQTHPLTLIYISVSQRRISDVGVIWKVKLTLKIKLGNSPCVWFRQWTYSDRRGTKH